MPKNKYAHADGTPSPYSQCWMVHSVGRTLALSMVLLLVLSSILVATPVAWAAFPGPVADAGDDQSVEEGETVTFNGSGSFDLNDDPLNYTWDFDDSDGTNQADATGIEVTHVYEDRGIYTVTLTVSDGQFEDTDECRVTVYATSPDNIPPKALITSPLPGTVHNRSEAIDFVGTGVDLDDDPLRGTWDFGDGSTSPSPEVSHAYNTEGVKYITWTVTDEKDNNTARVVIYVGDFPTPELNRRPNAVIIAQKTNISQGERVRFNAVNSSDPDDDPLDYEWDFDLIDGLDAQATTENVTWQFNDTGDFTVSLQVRDGHVGGWDIATLDVTVYEVPNDPPVANAGNDAEVQMAVLLGFRGTASDPDRDNITDYMWDFGDGSATWNSSTNGSTTHAYSVVGDYTATFTVTDEHGATGSDTRRIVVKPPPDQPPTADAGPDIVIMESQTAFFEGEGQDDFGIALFEWDFNSDGIWDYTSSYSGSAPWTYMVPGVFTAILRVTENNRPGVTGPGKKATDSCVVTVRENQPPIADIRVDNLFVNCGEVVRFRSESTDPEKDKLTYAWDLNGDGTVDSTASNPSYVYRRGGDYQVTLTVTDELANTDSDVVTMQVQQTFGVTVEVTSPVYEAAAGERHDFRLTVQNTGNGDDMLRLTVGGTNAAWGTVDRTMVGLNASERQTVTLVVRVPSTARSTDEAKLTVTAKSTYGSAEASGAFELTVMQRFSLKATIDVRELSLRPGETGDGAVRITITNDGNGPDSFRVMFSGDIAGGGFLTATPPKVDVGAGESRDVTLSAFVDAGVKPGKYTGTITVSSTKSTTKQTFEFTLTVRGEELPAWQEVLGDPLVILVLIIIVIASLMALMATAKSRRRRVSAKKTTKG